MARFDVLPEPVRRMVHTLEDSSRYINPVHRKPVEIAVKFVHDLLTMPPSKTLGDAIQAASLQMEERFTKYKAERKKDFYVERRVRRRKYSPEGLAARGQEIALALMETRS